MIESVSLPKFSDDLSDFVSRMRTRLFATQEKAAYHFGLKSHGTISRYESGALRPPLGYVAHLAQLYVDKVVTEGQVAEASQSHFLREVNRAINRCYSWDEAVFHNWQDLCGVADAFMTKRRQADPTGTSLAIHATALEDKSPPTETITELPQNLLKGLLSLQALTFLFGDTDKQRSLRNRQAMLKLVKEFWIEGVLENSLHHSVMIELGLEQSPDAVAEHPWDVILQTAKQQARSLAPGTKMIEVFNRVGQTLLILGEPGGGKTTMLLDLARDLLILAEQDPTQPIPIVFTLSSWAGADQLISEWLIEELHLKYRIPQGIARSWVEGDELLPLLDGLDEVALIRRNECVSAINRFHQVHLTPLVVCSRVADYKGLTTRLTLRGAVLLQPLTETQINAYFAGGTSKFNSLAQMLQEDIVLRELARTPLMLNIMILAYEGLNSNDPQPQAVGERLRQYLFDTYIRQIFQRKGTITKPYSDQQTIAWLGWLALQMIRHNQTIFLIEQLQPSWLASQRWCCLYLLGSRLTGMLFGGLLIGFASGVVGVPLFHLANMPISQPTGWLTFGLMLGLTNGLLLTFLDGVRFELDHQPAIARKVTSPWRVGVNAIGVGLMFGLIDGLIFRAFGGEIFGLIGGLALGLLYGISIEIRASRHSLGNDIHAIETLNWSWRSAGHGAMIGAIAGLLGTIGSWLVGLNEMLVKSLGQGPLIILADEWNLIMIAGVFSVIFLGTIGTIFGGVVVSQAVEANISPDQGIRLSSKYALLSGLGFGLISGLLTELFFWPLSGLDNGLKFGLASFICFGGFAFLWYGGLEMIQHYTLRLILWQAGDVPYNLPAFLDFAVDHIFLRNVGGGYVFIHRLMMEHFASLTKIRR